MNQTHRIVILAAVETRPLRHRILRPNQTPEACVYPEDDHPATRHFGCLGEGRLVGVASIFNQAPEDEPDQNAWRIRGMAVIETERGRDLGMALLQACIDYAHNMKGSRIWCNARVTVSGFYAKSGFQIIGEPFDLPAIGPHYQMALPLSAATTDPVI